MSESSKLSPDSPTESAPISQAETEPEIPIDQDPWAYVINLITLALSLRGFAELGGGNAIAWRRVDAEVEEIAQLPGSMAIRDLVAEMRRSADAGDEAQVKEMAARAFEATMALLPEEVAVNVRAKIEEKEGK